MNSGKNAADCKKPKSILDFYTKKNENGETIFQLWKNSKYVRPYMTPSVYDRNYSLIIKDLLEISAKSRNEKYLSIGSGVGKIEKQMMKEGFENVMCVDIFGEAAKITKRCGLNSVLSTGLALPFRGETFDIAYMDGSIGHMTPSFKSPFAKPFQKPLKEVNRVLKKKGSIIICDDPANNGKDFQLHPRVNFLRVSDRIMIDEIEKAGFKLKNISTVHYQRRTIGKVPRRVIVARKK